MVSLLIVSIKNFFEILQIHYTTVFIGMLERSNRRYGELNPSRKGEWGGATPTLHSFHILHKFGKGTSGLCSMFGVSQNSIFFHYNNFFFRDINKAQGGCNRI